VRFRFRTGPPPIARSYPQFQPWPEGTQPQPIDPEGPGLAQSLFGLPAFLRHVMEEITRAERYQRAVGIVVFQLPILPPAQRRPVEAALRAALRRSDIPARLSEHMLRAILPETGPGAAPAAARLARLLSEVAGAAVTRGFASYPADGQNGSALLRIATERMMT
jgi:hypothetical protein